MNPLSLPLANLNIDNIVELATRNQLMRYKLEKLNTKEIYQKNKKLFKEDLTVVLRACKSDVFMDSEGVLMIWDSFATNYADFLKFVNGIREKIFSPVEDYPENLKQLNERGKKIYNAWKFLKEQKLI